MKAHHYLWNYIPPSVSPSDPSPVSPSSIEDPSSSILFLLETLPLSIELAINKNIAKVGTTKVTFSVRNATV